MLKRTPLNKGTKSLSRKTLRRVNPEALVKRGIEKSLLQKEDNEFYEELWRNRSHYSELDSTFLGNEFSRIFAHHLLPKESNPQFRHCSWNILFCTASQHSQIELNPDRLEDYQRARFKSRLEEAKTMAKIINC